MRRLRTLLVIAALIGLSIPTIAFAGSFLVLDISEPAPRILRIDASTGEFLGVLATLPMPNCYDQAYDLEIGPAGSLAVACGKEFRLLHLVSGADQGLFGVNGESNGSQAFAFGPTGSLYSIDDYRDVVRFSGNGAYLGKFIERSADIYPTAILFGRDGTLLLATDDGSGNNAAVRRYNQTSAAFLDFLVPPGALGSSRRILGMAFGPSGDLFVDDGQRISRFDGGSGAAKGVFVDGLHFSFVGHSITWGPDGDLYALDEGATRDIKRFDGATGQPKGTFATIPEPGSNPRALLATCATAGKSLCLQDNRFEVESTWRVASGDTGFGQAVKLTPDTGYFWFFGASNVETVVKLLDACVEPFDHFWVFAAGLTDVAVELRVLDTSTGLLKVYSNQLGVRFAPIQDTDAFPTCTP